MKITETYNGEEFEVKIKDKIEFEFAGHWIEAIVLDINFKDSYYIVSVQKSGISFRASKVRPVQKKEVKPLSAEELYRICGKNGYEVKVSDDDYGIISGIRNSNEDEKHLRVSGYHIPASFITHFRKAYSQDEWKPISEIERE